MGRLLSDLLGGDLMQSGRRTRGQFTSRVKVGSMRDFITLLRTAHNLKLRHFSFLEFAFNVFRLWTAKATETNWIRGLGGGTVVHSFF